MKAFLNGIVMMFVFVSMAGCAATRTTTGQAAGGGEKTEAIRGDAPPVVTGTDIALPPLQEAQTKLATPEWVTERMPTSDADFNGPAPDSAEALSRKMEMAVLPGEKHEKADRFRRAKKGYDSDAAEYRAFVGKKPDPEIAGDLVLNFDDADLYEVIRTIAELLKINYMIDPAVRGKVTIHTSSKFNSDDLWPVFFQILEANNLTAVREDKLYRITPLKEAPRLPVISGYGQDTKDLPPGERVIMQIVPLKHLDGSEMTKILTPFLSAEGTVVSHADSNTLLIVDKGLNVLKALRLVQAFDTDMLDNIFHRFFFLKNSNASETNELLQRVISTYDKKGNLGVSLIPIDRLNAVLAISKEEKSLKKVEDYISVFDAASEVAQTRIYVYAVRNSKADNLASLLNGIFNEDPTAETVGTDTVTGKEKQKPTPVSQNPFEKPPSAVSDQRPKMNVTGGPTTLSTLQDAIKITADPIRNSLIILATPQDYRVVEDLLEKLDVLPRQVLIEATIAEITLDDQTKLGVEWSYLKGDRPLDTSLINAKAGKEGLSFLIGETSRWSATLSAWAKDNKVNIIATPSIMASDNREASINISTEVPVVSSTYNNQDSKVITSNVQYRNTGLILTVTPHINENGLVSMDINQEVSEQAGSTTVAGASYPTFFKRNVTTSFVVKHNQTIIIGGLIRETKSAGKTGVPIFSKIPGFGFLFGEKADSIAKSELILFITPHVIGNLDDVDALTRDFKQKVNQSIREVMPEKY